MEWFTGFVDELEKIAISRGRLSIPKARSGRRSMSVATMLRKDKEGTLYKEAEDHESKRLKTGLVGKLAAAVTEQANAVYQEFDPKNPTVTPPTRFRRGDVPAREDIPGKTTAEYRPDVSGSTASRGLAPEGYSG